jgi:ABC-2 type transport system ATP-binding protein
MTDNAISTERLTKVYGKHYAVDGIELKVPRGAVYGYLGRNGAGKTTTIKMLLGLARPTSGAATVLGLDPQKQTTTLLERVAFASSAKQLYNHLTGAELIRFAASFSTLSSIQKAEEYARRLEVPLDKRFGKLSQGNRSKLCLILALAQDSDLLVLDEPTTGLDPFMVDEVLRILIEDHANEGRTIFFSSHQLAEVEQICDWIGIIDRGRLLLEARLEDVRENFRQVTACGDDLPRQSSLNLVYCQGNGRIHKYMVKEETEIFVEGLRKRGAQILECSPLSLREIFLQLIEKE